MHHLFLYVFLSICISEFLYANFSSTCVWCTPLPKNYRNRCYNISSVLSQADFRHTQTRRDGKKLSLGCSSHNLCGFQVPDVQRRPIAFKVQHVLITASETGLVHNTVPLTFSTCICLFSIRSILSPGHSFVGLLWLQRSVWSPGLPVGLFGLGGLSVGLFVLEVCQLVCLAWRFASWSVWPGGLSVDLFCLEGCQVVCLAWRFDTWSVWPGGLSVALFGLEVGLLGLEVCHLVCLAWRFVSWSVWPGGLPLGLFGLGVCQLVCLAWKFVCWSVWPGVLSVGLFGLEVCCVGLFGLGVCVLVCLAWRFLS